MNKKIISAAFSTLISVALAASANPGDCSKYVDGQWKGKIGSVSGICPSKYSVNTSVLAEFHTYEYYNSKDGTTTCNVNFPTHPEDVSTFSFESESQKISGSFNLYSNESSDVLLSIGDISNGQANAKGKIAGSAMTINMTPADASDCALSFVLNK